MPNHIGHHQPKSSSAAGPERPGEVKPREKTRNMLRPALLNALPQGDDPPAQTKGALDEHNLFRVVIDNLPVMVYIKDEAGRYLMSNALHLRALGMADAREVLGKTDQEFMAPELAAQFGADEERVIQSGEPLAPHQETYVWPDGHTLTCISTAIPLRDEHHRVVGVVRIISDISQQVQLEAEMEDRVREQTNALHERTAELQERTAQLQELMAMLEATNQELEAEIATRREAEAAVARERNLLRTVIDLLPDHIYVKDTRHRVILSNIANAMLAGFSDPEQMIGTTDDDYFPPELAARHRSTEHSVLETGQSVINLEEPLVDRAGNQHVVLTTQVPLRDEDGRIIGLIGIGRDVTGLKRLEENLRQAQRMESVGRLAGGVAHDFNNLLTVINGYTELLLHMLDDESPLREPLEQIKKAGAQTAALTRQLLAFSRKQVLQPRRLDLNHLVTSQEPLLRRLIGADVELVIRLDPELAPVLADPSQLEQVLMNLVLNARDAMPHGGQLTIETTNVQIPPGLNGWQMDMPSGDYVRLSVSDTGCGMDAETLSHIFEPFFTTKEAGRGTGLGLATVYGIVTQSGGHVWVHSRPGSGTRFDVYLPQASGEATVEPVTTTPSRTEWITGSETILVVEDNAEVRNLACRVLREHGYVVLQASSAGDALLVHERYQQPIHLLLTDVIMPIMSGPELAQRLMTTRPNLTVLYMSGYNSDHRIVQEGVLEPGLAFIQKPFTPAELLNGVRRVLGGAPRSTP